MLHQIHIQNYALIDELTVDFTDGFSTLTGETGAGKSILLGALMLALGNRADTSAIGNAGQKCVVEATFNVKHYGLEKIFADLDLDYQDETIIRRELLNNGKSRAFVNDTPVNLNSLKDLGRYLIDIHSQHENLELNNNQFQLKVVDAAAQNAALLKEYSAAFADYKKLQAELADLKENARQMSTDYDYNQFQYNQLAEFKLEDANQEEMENEFQTLSNIVDIQQSLSGVLYLLQDSDQNILSGLTQVRQQLQSVRRYFAKTDDYLQRLEPVMIEMKDFAREVDSDLQRLENQPERLEALRSRLDQLYSLLQKHQAKDVAELIAIRDSLESKLSKSGNCEMLIEQTEKQLAEAVKEKTMQFKRKLLDASTEINGHNVIKITAVPDFNMLREAATMIQKETSNLVIAAAVNVADKPQLLLMYSSDLVAAGKNAGADIRDAAKCIQGGGGGQPGLATAGGKLLAGLSDAMDKLMEKI